jgi:hypothetical protein
MEATCLFKTVRGLLLLAPNLPALRVAVFRVRGALILHSVYFELVSKFFHTFVGHGGVESRHIRVKTSAEWKQTVKRCG